ncbi:hypothetical protein EW093_00825 [Thiospirochaeta perfilievii]|uniref:DUF3157 family protein n=1 Tax=Thiospirochaeta perfilievii TaxID=252967 RepID=A0A5C1Q7F0_9SPIO|nr:hypothetical protein [Thiospirochaeta perfilievii]QEN03307.1 hypothetical protein EW093_00825 [Thiospirochaeta perfilievii]
MNKKIVLTLLLIAVSFLQAEETVFTKSGNKILLKDDNTWEVIENSLISSGTTFRQTIWGMTKKEVMGIETTSLVEGSNENNLMYTSKVAGKDCYIIYFFTQDILTSARYFFTEKHSNKNDFILDYNSIKELLTDKYSNAIKEDVIWRDDLYKDDFSDWGLAISIGDLLYFSDWEDDKTEIHLVLMGENYSITHLVDYQSKEMKEMTEKIKNSNTLNDL